MEIAECRTRIDAIDDELAELFRRRMDLALEVAQYKKEHGLPVLNRQREREILARVTDRTGEELAMYTRILFTTLFELSRARQVACLAGDSDLARTIREAAAATPPEMPKKAVVACQGIEGAYSQAACDHLFPLSSIVYMNTFESVFAAVDKGLCRYGILPIENSSYGSVNEVYDLMKKYSFFIARSIRLPVNHCLLARPGVRLADIREIYSHGQAIGQCSAFLAAHPGIRVVPCENTAVAARLVAESGRGDVAAISSHDCAALYGLGDLGVRVQNSDSNYTRFICISKSLEIYPGAARVSLMTTLPHTPGSLGGLLSKFSSLGLNLCKLESRPLPTNDFTFMFYFDIEASVRSEDVLRLLGDLAGSCEQFSFLGAYSEV